MTTTLTTNPPVGLRSRGRGYFWAGILACLVGLGAAVVQFTWLKHMSVPWYAPALATLGALLLVVAVASRLTITRVIALVLVVALAGFQWYVLVVAMKLPDYQGPARGDPFPAFSATLADSKSSTDDSRSFTDANLRDGSRRAMVFFRGRW
jgi:hypothetical protein